MTGLYHFDDGLSVSDENDIILQEYWFQEASPDQKQDYLTNGFGFFDSIGSSGWSSPRQDLFERADLDGNGKLNREEAHQFLRKVRMMDRSSYASPAFDDLDTRYERVDRHFRAINALANSSEISFNDYKKLEETMHDWYENGKLEATGYTKGVNSTDKLLHDCAVFQLEENDRIIYTSVESDPHGIVSISFQSILTPEATLSAGGTVTVQGARKEIKKWGDNGQDFAGFFGTTHDNGDLASFGWVVRDSICSQQFVDAYGADYTWTSSSEDFATKP